MEESLAPYALSVIVPVYEAERTLPRAILSLEEQDFPLPFEVLFAFDGGIDGSLAILQRAIAKHPSWRILLAPSRQGPGKGRLMAIKEAKGTYLAFLDSDDAYLPNTLSTFYAAITQSEADLVNASFYTLEPGGEAKKNLFVSDALLKGEKEILEAFFGDSYFRGFLWTKLIKRSLFEGHPLLMLDRPGDLFEDTALLASVLPRAQKALCIKDPLYYYDKSLPLSATSAPRLDRFEKHLSVYALIRAFYEEQKDLIALRSFEKAQFRASLALNFDASLDKKNGADPERLKEKKKEIKALFDLREECPSLQEARETLSKRLIELPS